VTSQNDFLVHGYDHGAEEWIAEPADAARAWDAAPALEGFLATDRSSLDAASRDLGRIVVARPGAVLRPQSAADVEAMVAFCSARGIPVSARGEAHTTGGQGLTKGGLIIRMGDLDRIHDISSDEVDVDGGVLLLDLVRALAERGLQVTTGLPGYLRLTLAGVLSVGGVSTDYGRGGVVDGVRALEIVTPADGRVWCSESSRPDLFHGALAGLGQLGVITRARLAVEPAPTAARLFLLDYSESAAFFRDTRLLLDHDQFDKVYCTVLPGNDGLPIYRLSATIFTSDDISAPVDEHLLRGLDTTPTEIVDMTYLEQAEALTHRMDANRRTGWDELRKPWYNEFVPQSTIERFTTSAVALLTKEDYTGPPESYILLQPQRAAGFGREQLRVPAGEPWFWLFAAATAGPPEGGFALRSADRSRQLDAHARSLGGVTYPVGTVTWSYDRCREHYGERWPAFLALKRRYDPNMIMTRGVGMFSSPRYQNCSAEESPRSAGL
jgi:FAD/FMN-containing dehydrogenase